MLGSTTVVRRRPELIAIGFGEETVMLDIQNGLYFGLAGVGPHIWAMLDRPCSIGAIIDAVRSAFAIDDGADVERDVTTFVHRLIDKGLVTVDA